MQHLHYQDAQRFPPFLSGASRRGASPIASSLPSPSTASIPMLSPSDGMSYLDTSQPSPLQPSSAIHPSSPAIEHHPYASPFLGDPQPLSGYSCWPSSGHHLAGTVLPSSRSSSPFSSCSALPSALSSTSALHQQPGLSSVAASSSAAVSLHSPLATNDHNPTEQQYGSAGAQRTPPSGTQMSRPWSMKDLPTHKSAETEVSKGSVLHRSFPGTLTSRHVLMPASVGSGINQTQTPIAASRGYVPSFHGNTGSASSDSSAQAALRPQESPVSSSHSSDNPETPPVPSPMSQSASPVNTPQRSTSAHSTPTQRANSREQSWPAGPQQTHLVGVPLQRVKTEAQPSPPSLPETVASPSLQIKRRPGVDQPSPSSPNAGATDARRTGDTIKGAISDGSGGPDGLEDPPEDEDEPVRVSGAGG